MRGRLLQVFTRVDTGLERLTCSGPGVVNTKGSAPDPPPALLFLDTVAWPSMMLFMVFLYVS